MNPFSISFTGRICMQTEISRSNGNDYKEVEGPGTSSAPPVRLGSRSFSTDTSRPSSGGRATDSARVARFKKELASPTVNLGMVYAEFRFMNDLKVATLPSC